MVCLSRLYPLKFFKGCLPQNLLSPLLNILSQKKRKIITLLFGIRPNKFSYTIDDDGCGTETFRKAKDKKNFLKNFLHYASRICQCFNE